MRVHVTDRDGVLLFNRLEDDGGERLRFESGHGWLSRSQIKASAWTIAAGWAEVNQEPLLPDQRSIPTTQPTKEAS
jgi:hypothetical protein